MHFIYQIDTKPVEGIVRYVSKDYALDFEPIQVSCYEVLIGDLTMYADENFQVRQVWGYNPMHGWRKQKLTQPTAKKGGLYFADPNTDGHLRRIEGTQDWKTYYDVVSGWICFGDCSARDGDDAIEFATNAIAVLHAAKIKALWLRPVIV